MIRDGYVMIDSVDCRLRGLLRHASEALVVIGGSFLLCGRTPSARSPR